MGRGSEPMETCSKCGRRVPRSKYIVDKKRYGYGTELGTADDVDLRLTANVGYCISCAKHGKILEKLKRRNTRSSY